jgi:hypothetical protein
VTEEPQQSTCPVCAERADEFAQLRRWLLAISLGRATKEDHAAIRDYLREIGW